MRMIKIWLFCVSICLTQFAAAQNWDLRLLESINGPPNSADGFWRGISASDYVFVTVTPLSVLATGIIKNDKELTIKGIETAGAVVFAEGATVVLKDITRRERPYLAHPGLIYGKTTATDYSFPSGHTSTAFAAATSLSLAFPKWYVIAPSFAYASVVGYSRLYLGAHYPSDVFAGALLGAGSAYLTFKLQRLLDKKIH
jgi:membrane-associated phospholipid phosphatase